MKSNEIANPKGASLTGPATLLSATAMAGLWLWNTHAAYVPLCTAVSLLVLTAALGVVWLYRVREARRFFAVLDAYAVQELGRAEHRPLTPSHQNNRNFSRDSI